MSHVVATLNRRYQVQRTLAWLVALLLIVLAIVSCVPPQHFQSAPGPSRRYYQERQRVHTHQRNKTLRRKHSPFSWSRQKAR